MVQSHVNELTTAATMLPAIRRTLEEFAVEINRLATLVESNSKAAKVGEAEGADVKKTKTKKTKKTAELELGL